MELLNKMYFLITPGAKTKKYDLIKNKIISKLTNFIYPMYSHFHRIPDDSGNQSIIVSLTSFPQRINKMYYCLYSLLNQELKPYKVVLWLANTQFPNGLNDVPLKIRKLKKFGLEIEFCNDYKSYKKIIPSLSKYNGKIIVTADDDVLYPENWLKELFEQHMRYPDKIICHRAHQIVFKDDAVLPYTEWNSLSPDILGPSKDIVAIGVGGILYPAHIFDVSDFNYEEIKEVAPFTDDIYLKYIELKKNIDIVKVRKLSKELFIIGGTQEYRLSKRNVECDNENDKAIERLLKRFSSDILEYKD